MLHEYYRIFISHKTTEIIFGNKYNRKEYSTININTLIRSKYYTASSLIKYKPLPATINL